MAFVKHGQRLSVTCLFINPLRIACREAALVDSSGRLTVTAHRFRHTVGTQLADRGAKLHTIMQVLGAMLGLLVGLVLGGPIGLLIGPFVGAVAFELLAGQAAGRALRSGPGAAVGLLVGRLAELAVSVGLIASFVFSVVTAGVLSR